LWTRRSRILSASVGSPICAWLRATGWSRCESWIGFDTGLRRLPRSHDAPIRLTAPMAHSSITSRSMRLSFAGRGGGVDSSDRQIAEQCCRPGLKGGAVVAVCFLSKLTGKRGSAHASGRPLFTRRQPFTASLPASCSVSLFPFVGLLLLATLWALVVSDSRHRRPTTSKKGASCSGRAAAGRWIG
jgi:hypothetical protein